MLAATTLGVQSTEQARRLAEGWPSEGEGNHSGHHADLRRSWADAADKVADAITALAKRGGPNR